MSTLTTIQASDLITNSRADINNNFIALNNEKIETSVLDTDNTLAADSDARIASQKAVKAYIASVINNILPIGSIISYGSPTPPSGWLLANGAAISRSTYSSLFGIIGTTFGTGDGAATFNLPFLVLPSAPMALLTSLVAYWKLDESSGDAADSSGNSNTLTNINTTAYATGILNNGADFEASNSNRLSIVNGSQTGLNLTTDFTFSLWIKLESTPGAVYTLISRRTSNTFGYELYYSAGTISLELMQGGSSVIYTAAQTFTNGTWYHLVVRWTNSIDTAEFFVNGASIGADVDVATIVGGSATFALGSINTSTSYFDGIMDEVAIWARALTNPEIVSVYNSGIPRPYSSFGGSNQGSSFIIKY